MGLNVTYAIRYTLPACCASAPSGVASTAPRQSRRRGDSFNHLIRPQQQRRRDRQAESFGGLGIYDELELRRLLNGKVRGLRALQNSINIAGSSFAALPDILPLQ